MDVRSWLGEHVQISSEAGAELMVRCPLHDDRLASCSVNTEKAVWFCHAGCGSGSLRELAERAGWDWPGGNGSREICRYDYRDADGKVKYQVVRFLPKTFRIYCPTTDKWSIQGVQRVPYRLPELLAALKRGERIFVAEGERDVDALHKLSIVATCNPGGVGGSSLWGKFAFEYFKGASCVLVPDADEPGKKLMVSVSAALREVGATVKVLDLGFPAGSGKDVSDWLADGHTREELKVLTDAASAPTVAPAELKKRRPLTILSVSDILKAPPVEWLVEGVLFDRTLSLLGSYAGRGKSLLALTIARSIADGFPLFGRFKLSRTGPVLFVDEENSHSDLRDRILGMKIPPDLPLSFISFQGVLIDDPESFASLCAAIQKVQPVLVVLDSLVRMHRAKENDASEMSGVMNRLRQLVNDGIGLLVLHHHTKGQGELAERARGSSDIVGAVDVEYALYERGDELVLQTVKTRRAPVDPLRLRIRKVDDELVVECLGAATTRREEVNAAILAAVQNGPQGFAEIEMAVHNQGVEVSERTLREAVRKLVGTTLRENVCARNRKVYERV